MTKTMQKIFGVLVALLAVATLITGVYSIRNQEQITKCQAEYNKKFIDQLRERTLIANQDREDLAELVTGILRDSRTPADNRKLLEEYLKSKKESDAERKKHPLPELPEDASC